MKAHQRSVGHVSTRLAQQQGLYRAILSLRTEAECEQFLADLCTPAELEALIDRWAVVDTCRTACPIARFHEITGVSVTTIGRVARFLIAGNGGYQTALKRLAPLLEHGDWTCV